MRQTGHVSSSSKSSGSIFLLSGSLFTNPFDCRYPKCLRPGQPGHGDSDECPRSLVRELAFGINMFWWPAKGVVTYRASSLSFSLSSISWYPGHSRLPSRLSRLATVRWLRRPVTVCPWRSRLECHGAAWDAVTVHGFRTVVVNKS